MADRWLDQFGVVLAQLHGQAEFLATLAALKGMLLAVGFRG